MISGPSYFYIASPYTHWSDSVKQARFEKVVDFTAWLIENYRYHVFSPIVHSHPLCIKRQLKPEFDFWSGLDKAMIAPAGGLIVFQIDGWHESKGIAEEIAYAHELHKPIFYSAVLWPDYDHES